VKELAKPMDLVPSFSRLVAKHSVLSQFFRPGEHESNHRPGAPLNQTLAHNGHDTGLRERQRQQ
jgi:hypothetical protein